MLLQELKTEIGIKKYNIKFPKTKSLVLHGDNALQLLYIIESLLAYDYIGLSRNVDESVGFKYKPFSKESTLSFKNGAIKGEKGKILTGGRLPKLHCIRSLNQGNLRSFVSSNKNIDACRLDVNMTKYHTSIPRPVWEELVETVNKYLGVEAVMLGRNSIEFNWMNSCEYPQDVQKFIYLIFAECFLTPAGYKRVILLSDLPRFSGKQQIALIDALDNLQGHGACISSGCISPSDIPSSSIISVLNV